MPSAHQYGALATQPRRIQMGLACAAIALFASRASAHGISEESRQTMTDGGIVDYIWLGAEHMVTGYMLDVWIRLNASLANSTEGVCGVRVCEAGEEEVPRSYFVSALRPQKQTLFQTSSSRLA